MAKKYTKNIKLEFAYQKVFSNINAIENIPIHDVVILESGTNLPKSKMQEGDYSVYGGGGATDNKHNSYNIDYSTVGIGRVGARCGCIFEIKSNSWVTDNALYIKSYDERFYLPYLKHFLSFSNLNQYANNAMQPVISKTRIKSITIPLIDIDKQKDISVLLDSIEFERDCDIEGFEDVLNNVKVVDIWKDLVVEVDNQQNLLKKLRQSILQEAIEGKLTASWREQNPDVESASVLLEKIKAEKEQLIKEKKLKKAKEIANSKTDRNIDIPSTWTWAKGDEIFFTTKLAGFEYTKHIKLKDIGEVPVIRAQNVRPFNIKTDSLKYIDMDTSLKLHRCALTKPALLVTFIGAGIGDVALFNEEKRWHLAPNVAKQEVFEGCEEFIDLKFINYCLMSDYGRKEIFKHVKATAQPSLSMGTIRDIDYALPPFEEQKEIVKKIVNLFKICDELETQIDSSKVNSEMLMQAVLKEAFEDDI